MIAMIGLGFICLLLGVICGVSGEYGYRRRSNTRCSDLKRLNDELHTEFDAYKEKHHRPYMVCFVRLTDAATVLSIRYALATYEKAEAADRPIASTRLWHLIAEYVPLASATARARNENVYVGLDPGTSSIRVYLLFGIPLCDRRSVSVNYEGAYARMRADPKGYKLIELNPDGTLAQGGQDVHKDILDYAILFGNM